MPEANTRFEQLLHGDVSQTTSSLGLHPSRARRPLGIDSRQPPPCLRCGKIYCLRSRHRRNRNPLALAVLEALARALLSVLLALLGARITRNHALGLELAAKFDIELHQRSCHAELHRASLPVHAPAGNVCDHVESSRGLREDQRLPCVGALRLGDKILFERAAVHTKLAAPRTKENPRDARFAPPRAVILNQISHDCESAFF